MDKKELFRKHVNILIDSYIACGGLKGEINDWKNFSRFVMYHYVDVKRHEERKKDGWICIEDLVDKKEINKMLKDLNILDKDAIRD